MDLKLALTKPGQRCVQSAQPEFMYVYSLTCCGTYKDLILKKQRLSNQTGDVLDVEIFFFFSLITFYNCLTSVSNMMGTVPQPPVHTVSQIKRNPTDQTP